MIDIIKQVMFNFYILLLHVTCSILLEWLASVQMAATRCWLMLGCDDEQDEATDQDEINSGPGARDQNKENVRAKKTNSGPAARDQNNENLCAVTPATREQNNENVRDASGAQDQNNNTTREAKTHSGGKDTKQMTYREALIGVGSSESSSDF